MRVAIASCKHLPEPDPDAARLLEALATAGLDACILPWDDDDAPFASHDLVVLRSTWNYIERVDAFVAWVERTAARTRVLNPAAIVAWNVRKTYLAELEERGVDVVPTEFVRQGAARRLDDILRARGWNDVVVKPVVSAGSFRTERFDRSSIGAGDTFLATLTATHGAMVQRTARGPALQRHARQPRWRPRSRRAPQRLPGAPTCGPHE